MDWIGFFKPTKLKISIFLILLLLSYFTLSKLALRSNCLIEIGMYCEEGKKDLIVPWARECRGCITEEEFTNSKILNSYKLLIWPQLLDYFVGKRAYGVVAYPSLSYLEFFVFPPIYFYLVSCVVEELYKKYKER